MAVEYRPMRPGELDAALDLWVAGNPGSDREEWRQEWLSLPVCGRETYVAALSDGTFLSTVHCWTQERRDATGSAQKVGYLSHVTTHPDARRRGHAGRLLDLTVEAMHHDGCVWSMLSADGEVHPLYERHGWRAFPTVYRQGALRRTADALSHPFPIRHCEPSSITDGWTDLAATHEAYNATRSLTMMRDLEYWQNTLRAKLGRWDGAILFVAEAAAPERACGYAIAHFSGPGFLVIEIGARPDYDGAIPALLAAVGEEAARRGASGGRAYLPEEPELDAALDRLFEPLRRSEEQTLMARPIAPDVTDAHLEALFSTPGAIPWRLDDV
jgi:GNAT superfamily N-acetyltransferase